METHAQLIAKIHIQRQHLNQQKFSTYMDKVFDLLKRIPAGKTYTVSNLAKQENQPLFTNLVKLYITDYDPWIEFTDDTHTQFKRCEPFNYDLLIHRKKEPGTKSQDKRQKVLIPDS